MKKIAILTAAGLISTQAYSLESETTCHILNVEIKKEKVSEKKIPRSENYVAFKKTKNRTNILKSALGNYNIESKCNEIKLQKNSIFAAIISSYDVASDGNKEWYHEETHCVFIDAKRGLMLAKKDQMACIGSWFTPREWITESGESFKF